jgi:glycosyltransferase involved in cell wall biosynthesis
MTTTHRERATPSPTKPRVLLINAFEKIPGERFRDQRYTFLYEVLKPRAEVRWLSSTFHHWTHTIRDSRLIPADDRQNVRLIPTLPYHKNISLRRIVSYACLSLRTLLELRRLPWRPDVIVGMGPVEQMFIAVLYGRLTGVPVIIDVIDTWPDMFANVLGRQWSWLLKGLLSPYFLLSRLAFAWTSQVSAVSETYASWARRRGRRQDAKSFSVFYLGCRNDSFDVGAARAPGNAVKCLFAGQFEFTYDVEVILSAARLLQSNGRTDIRFVLCGDGRKRGLIEREASQLPNVEVHGWVTPEELNRIAMDCQVGLCCYTSGAPQSIPTKIFDYLSMGLYVISSLEGEPDRLLRQEGCGDKYVCGDAGSLIEAVGRARSHVEFGPGGRRRIREVFEARFDAKVIYERMAEELIFPAAAARASNR